MDQIGRFDVNIFDSDFVGSDDFMGQVQLNLTDYVSPQVYNLSLWQAYSILLTLCTTQT